jgi:3-isopropylmalate/(R)-2-methylmalate dehydratase small subunit
MDAFSQHEGVAAPLLQANIDTDAIIPSREMKAVSKLGLGEGLFAGWRYIASGNREPNPDFVLNRPEYRGCSILLGGENFGCGSSREHAVWALKEYGIRVIIAASFGNIFFGNCINNGLLPVQLSLLDIEALAHHVQTDPQQHTVILDLERLILSAGEHLRYNFQLENGPRQMLLRGLDPIDQTLQLQDRIVGFESKDRQRRPWAYLS